MTPSLLRGYVLAASMFFMLLLASSASANPGRTCQSAAAPLPNVGSLAEYVGRNAKGPEPSYVAGVGIDIVEGRARLASGQQMDGLTVISVGKSSIAEEIGIQSEHLPPTTAAAQVGLGAVAIGAILVFPPAAFAVGAIPMLHWNLAHDVIVAVDAERTRTICDLETLLSRAKTGETIYLTVIRDGHREQLQAVAPAGFAEVF